MKFELAKKYPQYGFERLPLIYFDLVGQKPKSKDEGTLSEMIDITFNNTHKFAPFQFYKPVTRMVNFEKKI